MAFIVSITVRKTDRGLTTIFILLGASVLTEAIVFVLNSLLGYTSEQFYIIYHFYIPLEYLFISLFFAQCMDNKAISSIILWSIIPVVGLSLYFSFFVLGLESFPGVNLNLIGMPIILWASITLLSLKPLIDSPIYFHPYFWICSGFLFYYSENFFHNFIYDFIKSENNTLGKILNNFVNKSSNFILYTSIIVGFICQKRLTKST